jgi:hypothetical protein
MELLFSTSGPHEPLDNYRFFIYSPNYKMIGFIRIGIGDIVRYGQSIGVVLEVTTENPSPTPGCMVHWLHHQPYESEYDWVLIDSLDVVRES